MSPRVVWVGLIVAFLLSGVVIQGVLLVAALNDPSFAVEPDYERKADRWDEHQQQQTRNRRLDWTIDIGTLATGLTDERQLWVELYDTWGKPIMDAEVSVETFHNARAGQMLRARLPHDRDGRYSTSLIMPRPGLWEVRVRAQRGETLFTATRRKSLARLPATAAGG